MAHISNPPLDRGTSTTRPAAVHGHQPGSIANPPLEGSRPASASTDDHENPPLDRAAQQAAPVVEGLENPRLVEATIENWFEAQLGSDTVPTVNPAAPETVVAGEVPTKQVATRQARAKKVSGKKSATKNTAKKKAGAKKAASSKTAAKSSAATGKRS